MTAATAHPSPSLRRTLPIKIGPAMAVLLALFAISQAWSIGVGTAPASASEVARGASPTTTDTGSKMIAAAQASLEKAAKSPHVSSTGWAEEPAQTWPPPTPPLTSATTNWTQAMAWDGTDGYVIFLSGQTTWTFGSSGWSPDTKGTTSPPVTQGMSMAWDPLDGYVLLFGGCCGGGHGWPLGVTWKFSGGVWWNITSSVTHAPSSREHAVLTWDSGDQEMLLIDGTANYQCGNPSPCARNLSETWSYAKGVWTNLTSVSGAPPARIQYGSSATDDAPDGYVVWVGSGMNSDLETWKFHAGVWTNITTSAGPVPPRQFASLAQGPDQGYAILFGGESCYGPSCTGYTLGDTWQFVGGTWVNLTSGLVSPPTSRAGAFITFDAGLSYDVLLDGTSCVGACDLNNTWTYSFPIYVSAPTTSPPSGRLDIRSTATFSTSAFGGDGAYTYIWYGLPTGSCSGVSTATVVCTPTAAGTYSVNVSVRDSNGASANSTHVPYVVNPFPAVSSFSASPQSDTVGQPTTISVILVGGTAPFSYVYSGLPAGCATVNASSLVCTPTAFGRFNPSVSVTDTDLNYASASAILWVNPTSLNVLSPTATPSSGLVDATQTVTFTTSVTGGTGVNNYEWTGLPTGCTSTNSATLSCQPSMAGNYSVAVTVVDSNGTSVTSTALPFSVNTLPTAGSLVAVPLALATGQTTILTTDAWGGTAPLAYNYTGLPSGCKTMDSSHLTCTPTSPGSFPVKVVVTDATGANASTTVILDVSGLSYLNVEQPALSPSVRALDVGQEIFLSTEAGGGDGGYSFRWNDLPAGCGTSNSRWVNCTPDGPGNHNITVTVTDLAGANATSLALPLTVNALPRFIAGTVAPDPVQLGSVVTYTVVESGGTGPLSYDYLALPTGCTTSNVVVLTCTPTAKGNYTTTVLVTDGDHNSAEVNISLWVQPLPPVVNSGSGTSTPSWLYYALIAAVGVVAVLAVLLLYTRRSRAKPGSDEEAPEIEPAPKNVRPKTNKKPSGISKKGGGDSTTSGKPSGGPADDKAVFMED